MDKVWSNVTVPPALSFTAVENFLFPIDSLPGKLIRGRGRLAEHRQKSH